MSLISFTRIVNSVEPIDIGKSEEPLNGRFGFDRKITDIFWKTDFKECRSKHC